MIACCHACAFTLGGKVDFSRHICRSLSCSIFRFSSGNVFTIFYSENDGFTSIDPDRKRLILADGDFYFDKRTNEVKGMIQIPEPAKESVIDQLYYYGKAAWRNQKNEPYDFHLFIAD